MTEFEKNHPQELEKFLSELNTLIDNYHHEIYMNDGIFAGYHQIIAAVHNEIANFEEQK
jgi:hypothetical protein